MRLVQDRNSWWITVEQTQSRCGPYPDAESATVAMNELRRLKVLLETQLGYKLIRPLGRGNFGEVWQALAPGDVPLALKIVSQMNRRQGRLEFKALEGYKHLNHINLSKIFAFWLVELPDNDQGVGKVLKQQEVISEFDSSSSSQSSEPAARDRTGTDEDDAMECGTMPAPPIGVRSPIAVHGTDGKTTSRSGSWSTGGESESRDRSLIRLVIAMQLGDMTLMDKLVACQAENGGDTSTAGNHGIPERELLRYIAQAGDALTYLNEVVGAQHCDIKPQNILLVANCAQVCDFGILRQVGDLHRTQSGPVFTPYYAAPEQHRAEISSQVDQYSLALTYAFLYTGVSPVQGRTAEEIYAKKLMQDFRFEGIPRHQCEVIERATMPSPDARFGSVQEMVVALERAVAEDNLTTWDAAKKWVYGIAMIALFMAVIGLAGYLKIRHGADRQGGPGLAIRELNDAKEFVKALEMIAQKQKELGEEAGKMAALTLSHWWQSLNDQVRGEEGNAPTRDSKLTLLQGCDRYILGPEIDRLCDASPAIRDARKLSIVDDRRDTLIDRILGEMESAVGGGNQPSLNADELALIDHSLLHESPRQPQFLARLELLRTITPLLSIEDLRAAAKQVDRGRVEHLANGYESKHFQDDRERGVQAAFLLALAKMDPRPVTVGDLRELLGYMADLQQARESDIVLPGWLDGRRVKLYAWLEEHLLDCARNGIPSYSELEGISGLFQEVFPNRSFAFLWAYCDLKRRVATDDVSQLQSAQWSRRLTDLESKASSIQEKSICRLLGALARTRADFTAAGDVTGEFAALAESDVDWTRSLLVNELYVRLGNGTLGRLDLPNFWDPLLDAPLEDPRRICLLAAKLLLDLSAGEPDEEWVKGLAQLESSAWQSSVELTSKGMSEPMAAIFALAKAECAANGIPIEGQSESLLRSATEKLDAGDSSEALKSPALTYAAYVGFRVRAAQDLDDACEMLDSLPLDDWRTPGDFFLDASRVRRVVTLLQDALKHRVPTDADFARDVGRVFADASRRAALATRLMESLGIAPDPSLRAQTVIALSRKEETSGEQWEQIRKECEELFRSDAASSGTGYEVEVRIAHADALRHLSTMAGSQQHKFDAILSYVRALQALKATIPADVVEREGFDSQLWERVIHPALELSDSLDVDAPTPAPEDSASASEPRDSLPREVRDGLYEMYEANGLILSSNKSVRAQLRQAGSDADDLAASAFGRAARFAPDSDRRLKSFIAQAAVLWEYVHRQSQAGRDKQLALIERLRALTTEITAADPACADGYHLAGRALGLRARLKTNPEEARSDFSAAKDALKKALELAERPAFLSDLAIVLVELSFLCPANRPQLLDKAEKYASAAVEKWGDGANEYKIHAQMTIGNALEDQAYHLGRFWLYPKSLKAFEKATDLCDALDGESFAIAELRSKAQLNLLRARLRYINDYDQASAIASNTYSNLVSEDLRAQLRKASREGNPREIIGRIKSELATLPSVDPRVEAHCLARRAELEQFEGDSAGARETVLKALAVAESAHDLETHRLRALVIKVSSSDLELIKNALTNSPSLEELMAAKQVLCPDPPPRSVSDERKAAVKNLVREVLENVPPHEQTWAFLTYVDIWTDIAGRITRPERQRQIARLRELIGVAAKLQLAQLETDAKLQLCSLLYLESRDDRKLSEQAASEIAATIEMLDRQGLNEKSLVRRQQLLLLILAFDAKTVDRNQLQGWFDLARLPWANDFRIDDDMIRLGLDNALSLARSIDLQKEAVRKVIDAARGKYDFLEMKPLDVKDLMTVPPACQF